MEVDPTPESPAEAVAIFRATVIGPVVSRALSHGQLATELRTLSVQRFRPPGADSTRTYSLPTLERWVYAYRAQGLAGLRPERRSDRGFAQELSEEMRELLLAIRRERPEVSVPLILATLQEEGRMDKAAVSAPTLRRLYAAHGLSRRDASRNEGGSRVRRRWQADSPGALWHGDVCHLTDCKVGDKTTPIRIHGLLDDASRYVVALEAHATEKEAVMLGMLVDAVRRHGKPDALYFDNGSTYRGEILQTVCARLQIGLLHAKPYDPQARGKMERFWRTLRQGWLNHLGAVASLDDLNTRLRAFLDKRYHPGPHAGLVGKSPAKAYAQKPEGAGRLDETTLRQAMTVRSRRRVSNDNIVSFGGVCWELDQGYLAGKTVTVAHCIAVPDQLPWVEQEGKRLLLHRLDRIGNGKGERASSHGPTASPKAPSVDFDPMRALLEDDGEASTPEEGAP